MMDNRRGFLSWIGKGLGGLCAAGALFLGVRLARPPKTQDLRHSVAVGPLASFPQGSSRYFPDANVYVFHGAQGIFAISGRCTHLGCSVHKSADGFACPCHGARFDALGTPLSGPAPRSLTWCRVTLDRNRQIWFHLDQTVPPRTWTRT